MSLLDLASLVLAPTATKEGKVYSAIPDTGDGDLSFTRATNGTRVNSAGLIEKVRTNLLLQSNSFDTTWFLTGAVLTSGQEGYDGTTNAWLLDKNLSQGRLTQSISQSGIQTLSVYAKKGTSEFLRMFVNGLNSSIYFDLNDGSVKSSTSIVSGKSTDVGGGWYRCEVAFNGTTTLVNIYPAESNSTAGTTGNIYIQDTQLETGDIATDYIPTTTTAVSVGMTANVPRVDYSGGGCPKLLLEPQRTNLVTFSEQLDNVSWLQQAGATITANQTTSPDGTTNADKLNVDTQAYSYTYQVIGATSAIYTESIYAKKGTKNWLFILNTTGGGARGWFNLDTGVLGTVASGYTGTITDVGNGWYRCTLTNTTSENGTYVGFGFVDSDNTVTPTSTGYGYLWGAQVEAGSYVSSYINTLSAASTRGADECSKTGISSLIGQTEGTIFYDGYFGNEATEVYLFLQNGASSGVSNSIYLQRDTNAIAFNVYTATQQSFIVGGTFTIGQRVKIAAAYKANDFVLYVNGVQIGTDNTGSVPTCDTLQFAAYRGLPTNAEYINVKGSNQALLFPTRLTNTELADLTTI